MTATICRLADYQRDETITRLHVVLAMMPLVVAMAWWGFWVEREG